MPASQGTPTIEEKAAVALGFGAAVGLNPTEIAAIQAGEQRDLTKAEQDVFGLFSPILGAAEQTGLGDLANMLTAVLGAIPSITSISGGVSIINAILQAESGPLQKQAIALGQTSLTTLVTAALAKVGKSNLPLVA